MGFDNTWNPSFNVEKNGRSVLKEIPYIKGDDFVWLCNKLAEMYKKHGNDCMDNVRICMARYFGKPTLKYEIAKQSGCCGFYDEQITNPKTGNIFWIGCNYGH